MPVDPNVSPGCGTYEVIPHRIFVGGFAPSVSSGMRAQRFLQTRIFFYFVQVTEADLRDVFSKHGQVKDVKVVRNTDNGISKGYAQASELSALSVFLYAAMVSLRLRVMRRRVLFARQCNVLRLMVVG